MKQILFFLAFLLCVGTVGFASAQSLVLEPSSKTVTCNVPPNDTFPKFYIHFTNSGKDTVILKWRPVQKDLGAGWDYSICDYGNCYAGIPESGTMRELPPDTIGFMALNLHTDNGAGPGLVKIFVYKEGTPDVGDTLTWIVNYLQAGVKDDLRKFSYVSVYPSPTWNSLKCTTGSDILIRSITLYRVDGKKALALSGLNVRDYQIDVSDLSAGMYIAHLQTSDGLVTLQKVEKIK